MAITAQSAQHSVTVAKRAAAHPWIELLERAGYVARGVLYAVMGSLALGMGTGFGGKGTAPPGSLATMAGGPFGKAILLGLAVGLAGYSLWGFVRAVFDPLH